MKLSFKHDRNSLLSNIVLHGLSNAVEKEKLMNEYKRDGEFDIELTINGQEVNVESFVQRWQEQVRESINREAVNVVDEKFRDINDLLYDLETEVKNRAKHLLEEE